MKPRPSELFDIGLIVGALAFLVWAGWPLVEAMR